MSNSTRKFHRRWWRERGGEWVKHRKRHLEAEPEKVRAEPPPLPNTRSFMLRARQFLGQIFARH